MWRHKLSALGILFAVTASAPAGAQLSSSQIGNWARLLQMADGRKLDTTLVREALRSGVPALRAAAVLSIGQVGKTAGTAGIPILRETLRDENAKVASNSAYALGLLGDSGAVPQLRAMLTRSPEIAKDAAWALGAIGAAARPAILAALADQSLKTPVKVHVLLAAAKLRPVPVAELRPYLRSRSASEAWAAAYSIARSRAVPGARDLIALVSSPAVVGTCTSCNPSENALPYAANNLAMHRARAEVARMLVKTVTGDTLASQAIEVLKKLANDPSSHVRINAIRSLATFGASVRPNVLSAIGDRDPNVRIAASQVVGGVLDSAEGSWRSLWTRDSSFMYQTSLASSAAAMGILPPAAASWESASDWRYRAALAGALGSLPNRVAPDPVILRLTSDRDPRVRSAALNAIVPRDTLKMTPAIRSMLVRALTDDDVDVRTFAVDALSRTPNVSELDAVLSAYARSRRDSSSDARISSVQYLSALWKRDSANFPSGARDLIARLGAPTDPLERGAAGTSSLFSAWPAVFPRSREPGWYEEIVRRLIVPALRGNSPRVTLSTVRGPIVLELFALEAPLTVNNIITLANSLYYKGTRFHRVVPNFVAQDGDPTGTGSGGPGYSIRDEMNPHRYERGALGMALSGPDTGGSQYFITHSPQPHLDGGYTVFGRVRSGWSALDAILQGDLIRAVTVKR